MAETVGYSVDENVAVLKVSEPPNNALTSDVCAALIVALQRAGAAPEVQAVVIIGASGVFSAGYPIGTLSAKSASDAASLCISIETFALPVVAAASGVALGAGLDVVLACHYRLADAQAKIGFPEVGLGLMSGAGGTQRAPRLAGADVALEMMLTGVAMSVTDARARVFFDYVVKSNLEEVAVEFAKSVVAEGLGVRPTAARREGLADSAAFDAALSKWRARAPEHAKSANQDILDSVEACRLLPFDAGLAFEAERFKARVEAPEFLGLRHIAVAERRAAHFPELASGAVEPVKLVGVIGLGAVGVGFAVAALMVGFDVVCVERGRQALESGMERIRLLLDKAVGDGRLSAKKRDRIEASLFSGDDLVAVAEADFVLEASGQNPEVERQIFAQLDGVSKEGAVLAAHGPLADVDALALETGCPEEVMGLYFPTAAHLSPGVEVVVGVKTSDATVVRALSVLKTMNKAPVRVTPHVGLIGHTVSTAALRAAEQMVLRGAVPQDVDRAIREWGMSLGPFEAADLAGLEAPWLQANGATLSVALARRMCTGRASGRGWYQYEDNRAQSVPAELDSFLHQQRSEAARDPKTFSDTQIQTRCLAAMANAGVGLLRKGVVASPADIDVAMVHGFGFPRWRGGPMMAAQQAGLVRVRATLRAMKAEGDSQSAPDPVFDHLIKNGGQLAR
ncbi:Fatty acid oxidation complex subunit alpha [Shimia sp. SK013]|uniref:3-hydroxyacyl-CoA dehydrogenase NAD-binding domain-containing protein n=1 Tax=Shimia sp. SK013 TaxID=1389006 RepID=UPI0006CDD8BE|nr:3-hydroxyacyl-CoA dehydrogenase NAD-binding domain-containing protein [Shimia sp. SK013]KPA23341.1 Fatty acid oxidation complex subunit alpha [Shimia sp. SK013]